MFLVENYRILTLFQSLFNEVKDRGPSIEDVNTLGGCYISEAKVSRFIQTKVHFTSGLGVWRSNIHLTLKFSYSSFFLSFNFYFFSGQFLIRFLVQNQTFDPPVKVFFNEVCFFRFFLQFLIFLRFDLSQLALLNGFFPLQCLMQYVYQFASQYQRA